MNFPPSTDCCNPVTTPTKTRSTFPADDLAATTVVTEASIHVNSRDLMAVLP